VPKQADTLSGATRSEDRGEAGVQLSMRLNLSIGEQEGVPLVVDVRHFFLGVKL
jgi:hypothetical protein